MKILAHPLSAGGYITYLLDDTGRQLVSEMKDTQQEIVDASVALAKKYNVNRAQYVEDYSATSRKSKWKIKINT